MDGVSVIIPMKNAELTIEKCILSIVNQSYSFLEIIVCDDGSADGSIAVVEHLMQKYDNITLLKNKVSKGVANARNRCIAEAKYNYIAVQDADDWSARDRIEKEMSFLATHPEYAVVGSGCYRVNEFGEKKIDIPMEYISKKDLIWGGHFVHASCIFRKEVLCEVGGYTDNKYTKRDQDYHLLLKLYGKGYRLYNLQECLYYYLSTDATYIRQIDCKRWIVRTYTKQEQTCMIKTDLLLSYFTSSLSGFRQFAGRSGDQGSRSSRKPLSVSSRCFGISASRYSK